MAATNPAHDKKLSFEKAIEELESIVKRLEEGKVPLEESVAIYERGEALKRRCEEVLRQAEARVEKITLDASGKSKGTEPLDVRAASVGVPGAAQREAKRNGALQTRDRTPGQAPDQHCTTSRLALGAAAHPGHARF